MTFSVSCFAEIEHARDLMEQGSFKEAMSELLPAARSGNADAEELIGVMYAMGFTASTAVQLNRDKLVSSVRVVQDMVDGRGRARGCGLPGMEVLGSDRLVPRLGDVQAGELTTAF